MAKYFGTDGIRGTVGEILTPELAQKTGRAIAVLLKRTTERPTVVVGKDPRISSDMLEAALTSGLCAGGADVVLLGVIPTPAVAFLVTELGAAGGVMISASHNPYGDNGIKIFSADGFKLPDDAELAIEDIIDRVVPAPEILPHEYGRVFLRPELKDVYVDKLAGSVSGDFSGIKLAVDCSNGCASRTAADVFAKIGANFVTIHDNPDGININDGCGSTHIETLGKYVVQNGLDFGVAFDGDSDRCLAVDQNGREVDGDMLVCLAALEMQKAGKLANDGVVITVMSNLGLVDHIESCGIKILKSKVGDRYVLEKMLEEGYVLGGEASGHVIFLDIMTSGDGQLMALKLLELAARSGKSLAQLTDRFEKTPSTLINLRVPADKKHDIMEDKVLSDFIAECERNLPKPGRILVRPSGTEPLVRILTECVSEQETVRAADAIRDLIVERWF